MEWHELEKTTVIKLREQAHDQGIKGVSGKNKAVLIDELAAVLGIDKPHEAMTQTVVHDKGDLKKKIRELKTQRSNLIESKDHKGLKDVRRQIHGLKRQIKKIHLATEVVG
jgi:hypothetical protein